MFRLIFILLFSQKNLNQNKLEDFRKQLKKIDEKYLQNKKDMQSSDTPTEQFKQQEKIIDGHLQGKQRLLKKIFKI